ncbi:MAG: undecaprenyl/decaprenyl-phosphate alpha-N-acetylglucosaminyl 1-phosphate transferase [Nitrosomonadales bacterium]|nr:undecaprenyl/decaprenyl-phosphate alpha-N-acetylglucosaminyl 1-phosphate transferase [Nitrosomonadales bacterium]
MQVFIVSMLVCATLIVLLRSVAHRLDIVDRPGGRKQHEHPTPTVGGLAMFTAVLVALLIGDALHGQVAILMGCAAVLVVLGVLDDKHGLPVSLRMLIQIFMVLVVIVGAGGTVTHLGALFGSDIRLGLFAVPFSVVAFVGGINAINMIDGADGMAGKMALLTTLGVATIFYLAGAANLLPLTWAMLGALLGFLFLNSRLFVKRAWVFMGDAGSMWLGLVLGWFMAQITRGAVSAEPGLVLWLFGIPLIDTLVVMTRRIKRRQSPFAADRTHIHHVLQHAGLSVRRTVMVLGLAQLVLVGIGVVLYLVRAPSFVVCWSFVLLIAAYYYRLRHVR